MAQVIRLVNPLIIKKKQGARRTLASLGEFRDPPQARSTQDVAGASALPGNGRIVDAADGLP